MLWTKSNIDVHAHVFHMSKHSSAHFFFTRTPKFTPVNETNVRPDAAPLGAATCEKAGVSNSSSDAESTPLTRTAAEPAVLAATAAVLDAQRTACAEKYACNDSALTVQQLHSDCAATAQ